MSRDTAQFSGDMLLVGACAGCRWPRLAHEALSASATARRSRNSPCTIIRVTVVLALKCADGVVLGADSQITDSDRGLSYPAQKLHPFGETAAWGGSGARAVLLGARG
jgi:20S proteasome alpha/beta subunit